MGDTGSLLVGMMVSILSIKFIELQSDLEIKTYYINSAPAFVVAALILPLYDTLRVFTIRIYRGKSPFSADRRHIHHLLIDVGLSHMQATVILVITNFIFMCIAYLLRDNGNLFVLITIIILATILTYILHARANKKIAQLS